MLPLGEYGSPDERSASAPLPLGKLLADECCSVQNSSVVKQRTAEIFVMRPYTKFVVVVACSFILIGAADADPPDVKTLSIGAAAPDFKLPGVDGRDYTLKDFAAARLLLIVFTCNHCPTAQAYESRIAQLHADYTDKGVAVVAISPNDPKAVRLDELGYTDLSDSFAEMQLRAKERKFAFPYLYD